ncbi:GATA transcription factor 26-like protein [Drosera capensis]
MGKQGPCYHCGVTSTPLWRNGPPDKPVLCNACGSRWRTKGSLTNYTPLHSRAEKDSSEGHRTTRFKNNSLKIRDEKPKKRKLNYDDVVSEGVPQEYYLSLQKYLDEDNVSNRSSSGSAVSNSESCVQFGSADGSDLTGPSQSVVWDSMVPSRKRTCIPRSKPSPVEKLTKDLYNILHERSSEISGSTEEVLLFESETPMVSVEIGHGSVLMRHPHSLTREEDSEASSLSTDNKRCIANEAYSPSASYLVREDTKEANKTSVAIDRFKKPSAQMMQHEQVKREKYLNDRPLILNHNSPLCDIDLTDVVNIDVFRGHFTADEQKQLLKFLPSCDVSALPDSLASFFTSPHLKDNISSFKQLLSEGFFDTSVARVSTEDSKTLKKLILSNSSKFKWVEKYSMLKDSRQEDSRDGNLVPSSAKVKLHGDLNTKRQRDEADHLFSDMKTPTKAPRRVFMKAAKVTNTVSENNGSCFSPGSLLAFPTGSSSLTLNSFQGADEGSDQDLLLDVPSNGSFPLAELLHPASSFASYSSSVSGSLFRP